MKMKLDKLVQKQNNPIIGPHLQFEAKEAYNLLRANIMLSFSDDKLCRIIGLTSAERGDGKSVSAINTAYSFALTGKRVLLLEGDLRLPTVSKNLNVTQIPGLSNFLSNQNDITSIVKKDILTKNLDVITSGDIPPNPSELMGSNKMKSLLSTLSKEYDYIFIDMPPINSVSDAIVASPLLDGMLIVVRQNYTDRTLLLKAMSQFEYADVKVLGFVFNDVSEHNSKYYKNYKKTYRKYYYQERNKKGDNL